MKTLKFLPLLLFSVNSHLSAQVTPIREEAINAPHKHAWDLFLALNHPAKEPKLERGSPDLTKKIGEPGATVWETWKLARTEVFYEDGSKPKPWSDLSDADSPTKPKIFDLPKPLLLRAIAAGVSEEDASKKMTLQNARNFMVDIEDGPFNPSNFSGGGETRMNKATFDFVVENELYNIEGQEKLFADITSGSKGPLTFPLESVEAKAMWIELTAADLAAGKAARYHTSAGEDGKTYGLIALHIITKDIPNWFWCSFHQIDGKKPLVPPQDTLGRPSALAGTKWEFYALSGTQTDFTDSVGRATLLSDPHVENGFERSSCVTCHAQASIGAPLNPASRRGNRLPVFNIQRTNPDFLSPPAGFPLPANFAAIGTPYADQFFDARGKPRYVQLDFLYSLHIRANRKSPNP